VVGLKNNGHEKYSRAVLKLKVAVVNQRGGEVADVGARQVHDAGVEAIANMTGIMVRPVEKTARKAILPVLVEIVILNLVLGAAMNTLPDSLLFEKGPTGELAHTGDMLRVIASIYTGTVRAYDVVTMLQRDGHPTALGEAIAAYGRIFKTLHILAYIDVDETYRRDIKHIRNLQEGRHDLTLAPNPDIAVVLQMMKDDQDKAEEVVGQSFQQSIQKLSQSRAS